MGRPKRPAALGRFELFSDGAGRRLQDVQACAVGRPDHVMQSIAPGLRNRPHREAGTAGLAAVGSWAAAVVAAFALVMPALIRIIRPHQGDPV